MRVGAPRAVADLLVTAVPELRERLAEHHVRRVWSTLVGADVARRAKPQGLVEGCLTVIVDNSPWLHELTLRADELTARLRARFPALRALRFTLGTPADAGRFTEAIPALREALKRDPNSAYLWTTLAQWLVRTDAADEALAAARRAVELAPDEVASHTTLAELLRAQKKWAEAEAELE